MPKNQNSHFVWPLCLIALCLLILDQATKLFTHLYLPTIHSFHLQYPYGGIAVFEDFMGIQFSIHHVVNYGAAWGAFAQFQHLLLVVRVLLIIGMIYYAWKRNKDRSWRMPLTLIIVGATSNVLDYFIYGHVIDMFHFIFWGYDYPVFNIADSAVCIGVAWLALLMTFPKLGHEVRSE